MNKEKLIYDLPLYVPVGQSVPISLEANESIKRRLEEIVDLEQKLTYYNDNIKSLATCGIAGQVYFEWGYPDQQIKIYCGCENCQSSSSFNPEHEEVFLRLRAKEVDRIVECINKAEGYKAKLDFLFSTKGFEQHSQLTIHPNKQGSIFKNEENDSDEIDPVIDLTPQNEDEICIFDDFIRDAFNEKFRQGTNFSKAYNGFQYEKELLRFEKAISKATDPQKLIEIAKSQIENHFNYPRSIQIENKFNRITENINVLFAKLVLGLEIHLNEIFGYKTLLEFVLLNYTHVEEVVKFYRHLHLPLENITKGQKQKENVVKKNKTNPENLFGIWTKDEGHYDKVIKFLQEADSPTGSPFIKIINGRYQWQRFDHHITFLVAFIKECIERGYIEDKFSAPKLKRILSNTFNIDFNVKPLQSISSKDLQPYYSNSFKQMP